MVCLWSTLSSSPPSITPDGNPNGVVNLIPFNQNLQSYNGLCDEIYSALAAGAHRVATMGIRALVERLMIDQVQDKDYYKTS